MYSNVEQAGIRSAETVVVEQIRVIRPPGDGPKPAMARSGPAAATMGPMVQLELERIEALELLGMTLAHLNVAEAGNEVSPRVPLLMTIRDKLVAALREDQ